MKAVNVMYTMNYVNYGKVVCWWLGMIVECGQLECGSKWNTVDPGYLGFRVTWISTSWIHIL
jgi:hypothetical protein